MALHVAADGRTWTVEGGEAVVGRGADCRVQLDHELVSRRHAVLRRDDHDWVVEDLGSSNGTFVAGIRVQRAVVDGRLVVLLGGPDEGAVLELEVVAEPAPVTAAGGDGAASGAPPRDGIPAPGVPAPAVAAPAITTPTPAGAATVRVGRARDNDVVIDDLLVSRHHAELRPGPGGFDLVDVGSHAGTFVNGQRVTKATVREGDLLAFGTHSFWLHGGALEERVETGGATFQARALRSVTDGGQVLLDDVTFGLEPNSFLAVVGPSGSGKSTLLGALTGFRPATGGGVLYDGRDLYANYDELRSRIGLVPQDDVVHPQLTVRRALAYAASLRFPTDVSAADRLARVDEVMAELGLSPRADLRIDRLSGGQRKRVSVALELLTRPSLLFLDEPTSGLDPGYERSLMQTLRDLADAGRTVVVVTHSVQSLELCDRVLFLAPGGRTAYFGPPERVTEYFRREHVESVFEDLDREPARDWAGEFRAHPDHRRYLEAPLDAAPAAVEDGRGERPGLRKATTGWLRQYTTLVRRYLAVLASNRAAAGFLVVQPFLIGLLFLWKLPSGQLELPDGDEVRLVTAGSLVISNLILGATWLGVSSAVQEIVNELPVFRRERATGLSLSAYLASKATVLGTIVMLQCAVMTVLVTINQGGPDDGALLGSGLGRLELFVGLACTAFASMALGLLISSIVPAREVAIAALPIVMMFQLTLASPGGLGGLSARAGLEQLSYAASAQWGYSAAASTVNLNHLQREQERLRALASVHVQDPEEVAVAVTKAASEPIRQPERWAHTGEAWLADVVALVAIAFALLVLTGLALARRDPGPAS